MTALITVSNSDGVVGRCDAKCYDATGADCDCICGGKNHGAGLAIAQENVNEHVLEDWAEKRGLDPERLKLFSTPKQRDLFA